MSQSPYEVLARKYRPQRWEDLIGQEHVAQTLQNALRTGKIAHAFLFTGIRGVGKTTAARLLARALNCRKDGKDAPTTPEPCADPRADSACDNCREIAISSSIDVAEIDGASNRGIDNIRELNENVRYQPAKSRFRIYIIDEAHMVTREGFNALLKTLEEPPAHVKFIFATTAPDKFPDTIISRCQRYDFRRIPLDDIKKHLHEIADAEHVKLSPEALYLVAREAQGSMRDAESLLDRLMALGSRGKGGESVEIGDDTVSDVLGVTGRKTLHEAADAILRGDATQALEVVDAIYASGRDLERFSRDLLEHWRNLVVAALYQSGARDLLRELPANEIEELARQSKLRPVTDLQRLFRIAHEGDDELHQSEVPRFVLEMNVVRMATLAPVLPVDEVLARLEDIAGGERAARASARREAAAPPPVSRPAIETSPPRQEEEPPPPAVAAAVVPRVGNGEERWPDFLDFVQKRRISLYLTLSHARVVERSAERLVLGVAGEAFRKELESPGTLAEVEAHAREFFGASLRVGIISVVDDERTAPAPRPSAVTTLENPAVRKAVEILGGEVREVRNRPR